VPASLLPEFGRNPGRLACRASRACRARTVAHEIARGFLDELLGRV
jgi:hypothetical protein